MSDALSLQENGPSHPLFTTIGIRFVLHNEQMRVALLSCNVCKTQDVDVGIEL